jgi:integrase
MRIVLTDRTIRATKAKSTTYDITDTVGPGLRLRVTPAGSKTWSWRHLQRRISIGRFPGIGLAEARGLATDMKRAVDLGQDPKLVLRPPQTDTLANAVGRWQSDREHKGARRAHDTASAVRFHFHDFLDRPLTDLTRRAIRDRVEGVRDHGYPAAANRVLARLRTVLAFAVTRELIDANPALGIERPAREAAEIAELNNTTRTLTPAELSRVWRAAETLGDNTADVVRLLILTGCRRSEIGNLRWPEVDLDQRLLRIPGSRMKAGREHVVPLSDAAVAILANQSPHIGGDYVFGTDGRRGYLGWRAGVPKLKRLAGLDRPWVIHDLRRTVATHMVDHLEADGDLVARVLAHTAGARLGSVTARYERSQRLPARTALMEAWARWIASTLSEVSDENVISLHRVGTSR